MTTATRQRTLNGLDTRQLVETVDALKAQPALARFQFRNVVIAHRTGKLGREQ